MQDTLEAISIKEPVPLGDGGTLFWSRSHWTGQGWQGDFTREEFLKWWNESRTIHYMVPNGGSFGLVVNLNKPLRTSGSEVVRIFRGRRLSDWMIATETEISTDEGTGRTALKNLSLPTKFILCLRNLLMEFEGEELFCEYCCLPQEGDPLAIYVGFDGCEALNMEPDALLHHVATRFAEAFNKTC